MEQVGLQLINLGAGFDYLAGQVGPLGLKTGNYKGVVFHASKVGTSWRECFSLCANIAKYW
jgi:hypothetical protein